MPDFRKLFSGVCTEQWESFVPLLSFPGLGRVEVLVAGLGVVV